jgi:hypothetical protein
MDNAYVHELLDDYFRESTIDTLRERASAPEQRYTVEDAETLERLLLTPLYDWMDTHGLGWHGFSGGSAADDLIECIKLDIAYGFRNRQHVPVERIDKLDRLWQNFQRLAAIDRVADQERKKIEVIKRSVKGGRGRKKPQVTGPELRKFRDEYIAQHGFERGWKKSAAEHLKVTRATITAHENDQ